MARREGEDRTVRNFGELRKKVWTHDLLFSYNSLVIYRMRCMGKYAVGSCGAGGDVSGDHRLYEVRGMGGSFD